MTSHDFSTPLSGQAVVSLLNTISVMVYYAMQHKAIEEYREQCMQFSHTPGPPLFVDPENVKKTTHSLVRGVTGNKPKLSQADAKLVFENTVNWCYHHMDLEELNYQFIDGIDF